ncbi:response regulator transcription factor [Reichenbachiella carrageenanivorans]|uniref:Response regulator transcription factor n=1 Tax=Reichenbachiella carrageenanivorans TaxID=2979869 RepID=A0ABY6CVU8_9BACT|nr:response regulator transcription factor [Reichenbachiella carrageenanivorans]UXX78036.1 response regulator transcription factor [Reichenbachiella carrageenanivorans]
MDKKIRLVIADDHSMFLEGLKVLIEKEDHIDIVGTAKDGLGVLDLIKSTPIDIVITDLSMPNMDGLVLNKNIKSKYPKTKTIVVSTHSDSEMVMQLIKNDVDGYLLKNADPKELFLAISTVFEGDKYFSQEVKDKFMTTMFSDKKKTQVPILTKREKEIIRLITAEFTTSEIATQLHISDHTVNSHRKNLLSKLDVKNTAGLVKYALKHDLG